MHYTSRVFGNVFLDKTENNLSGYKKQGAASLTVAMTEEKPWNT